MIIFLGMANTHSSPPALSIEQVHEETIDVLASDSSYTLDSTKPTVTYFRIGVPEVNNLTIKTAGVSELQISGSGSFDAMKSIIENLVGNLPRAGSVRSEPRHDVFIESYNVDGKPFIRSLNLVGDNIHCHTEGCRIGKSINAFCMI